MASQVIILPPPSSGGGGSSSGGYDPAAEKFQQMLYAVNLTASLFEDTLKISEHIAKLGDFAEDAKTLLKRVGKNSGKVSKIIDIASAANDLYQDGVTPEGLSNFFSAAVGFAIGYTPMVGGIVGYIYDEVADEWVKEEIKLLIIDYFGDGQGGNPGMPQGPGN